MCNKDFTWGNPLVSEASDYYSKVMEFVFIHERQNPAKHIKNKHNIIIIDVIMKKTFTACVTLMCNHKQVYPYSQEQCMY